MKRTSECAPRGGFLKRCSDCMTRNADVHLRRARLVRVAGMGVLPAPDDATAPSIFYLKKQLMRDDLVVAVPPLYHSSPPPSSPNPDQSTPHWPHVTNSSFISNTSQNGFTILIVKRNASLLRTSPSPTTFIVKNYLK